jgi:hypothetical protein
MIAPRSIYAPVTRYAGFLTGLEGGHWKEVV